MDTLCIVVSVHIWSAVHSIFMGVKNVVYRSWENDFDQILNLNFLLIHPV
jgi:hypothetical protein